MIKRYGDHATNERTFLSWVRTVIAIVGFSLAAGRLGQGEVAIWSEIMMLVLGALVIFLAFLRMHYIRRKIEAKELINDAALTADALLFLLVAALFGLIAAFGIHVTP